MAIEGIFYVRISVADLARSKRFYGETLGWKLETDEPYVVGLWFGSGYVVCAIDPQAAAKPRDGGMKVAVRVDDIEAHHKQLADKGVDVSPIESRPWGQRDFSFADPDGYGWDYAQVAAR
jgi:catechol 2,3-dioxygenase-like lactoylglutathione lyase family enzyme